MEKGSDSSNDRFDINETDIQGSIERAQEIEANSAAYAERILGSLEGEPLEQEMWVGKIRQPRLPLDVLFPEMRDHFTGLGVLGSHSITPKDAQKIGTELLIEDSKREVAVFHLLWNRRDEIRAPVINPFVVVNKDDLLNLGDDVEKRKINLDELERDHTSLGYNHLANLKVSSEELEEAVTSDRQRRVIRALYCIHQESLGMAKFLNRLERQAAHEDVITLEEISGRTVNQVESLYTRNSKINVMNLRTEEKIIQLFEETRLNRIRTLARTVLLPYVSTIRLRGYDSH